MKKHGFTLVELLVVIAIIALLLSIVIPSLQVAREHARSVLCRTNLRGMGQAIYLYANDHDDLIAIETISNTVSHTFMGHTYPRWTYKWYVRYGPYYENPQLVNCPSTDPHETDVGLEEGRVYYYGDQRIVLSYTAQEHVMRSTEQIPTPPDFPSPPSNPTNRGPRQWRLSELVSLQNWRSVLVADGRYEVNHWGDWRPNDYVRRQDGSWDYERQAGNDSAGAVRYRHRDRAHFLTADGQVRYLTADDAYELPYYGWRDEIFPAMLR